MTPKPGYEEPTEELFSFILNWASPENKNYKLTYYDRARAELTSREIKQEKRGFFVFGLWPWQYSKFRLIKDTGEFRKTHFKEIKKDYYIAKTEVELVQPALDKKITLRGCAIKASPEENTKLIILTNLSF